MTLPVLLAVLNMWLHLLAAVAWVGGMLFVGAILAPTLRGAPEAERTALYGAVGPRFSAVGWASIVILLITGTLNVLQRVPNWEYLFASRAGPVLAVKLLFVLGMIVLSYIHDFRVGNRQVALSAALRAGGDDPAARAELVRLRRISRVVAQVNLVLGLLVLVAAVGLRWAW